MRFKIEYISKDKPPYVLARQLDEGSFMVNENTHLGGVHIKPFVSQPRLLTAVSAPDLAVYAFHLRTASDKPRLEVGSIVDLQTVPPIT